MLLLRDHDDDVSVAEACKKLNEVSGLRGMGRWRTRRAPASFLAPIGKRLIVKHKPVLRFASTRYFKQIAKSVRANGSASSGSEENADDFLGCINIPLNVSVLPRSKPGIPLAPARLF